MVRFLSLHMLYIENAMLIVFWFITYLKDISKRQSRKKQAYYILNKNNMFGINVADTCHRPRVKHFLCQISKNTLYS